VTITTVVMGFLQICSGVVLLQLSKSAKDVPDAAIFKGDLDQVREVAQQEHPESEPKADAIRGAASIIRRLSTPRREMEQQEVKRLREEKQAEHLEPLKENEVAEWDGLRRRKTVIGTGPTASPIVRRGTLHPPLGMTHFPDEDVHEPNEGNHKFLGNVRERAHTMFHIRGRTEDDEDLDPAGLQSPVKPVALTNINFKSADTNSPALPYGPGSFEEAQEHIYGLPVSLKSKPIPSPRSKPLPKSPAPTDAALKVPDAAKRQFSFSNMFRHSRRHSGHSTDEPVRPPTAASAAEKKAKKDATEEERLGLVQGDSSRPLMAASSPEHRREAPVQPTRSDSPEAPETASLYDRSPYSRADRYHRSASPDAISDDGVQSDDDSWQAPNPTYQQRPAQPFSFSSSDPPTGAQHSPQRPSSRNRPKPPAVYTPPPPMPATHTQDFAQSSERSPQPTSLFPQPSQGPRRITIGSISPHSQSQERVPQLPPIRSPPSLEPPVQFHPTNRRNTRDLSPIPSGPSQEDITLSETNLPWTVTARGRHTSAYMGDDSSPPTRSDNSNAASRERFVEQSARERAERRDRAKRRSYGPGQTMDFS